MAATHQAQVQMPKDFDKAGHKLLRKVADLSIKLGGHALAAYIDSAGIVNHYASEALQDLVSNDEDFSAFLQHQLEEYYGSQQQCVLSSLHTEGLATDLLTVQKHRQDAYVQRMPTLQHLAVAIADAHPDRAFFVYMHTGASPNSIITYQYAPARLRPMLSSDYWQELLQYLGTVPAEVPAASSSRPISNQRRSKRAGDQQEHPAAGSSRNKKRKLIAGTAGERGTLLWYRQALLISPAAYQTPLPDGAWALPDVDLNRQRLLVGRPVMVGLAVPAQCVNDHACNDHCCACAGLTQRGHPQMYL